MKYIANILTNSNFSTSEFYNVVPDRDSLIDGIPTLIIGWEEAKKEHPDASIIEWKLDDDVFWTYGKYERREKFEENIKKFNELVVKKFIESVTYTFYDVILYGDEKFKSFINVLGDDTEKTVYVSGDMLYFFLSGIKPVTVIGLSLRDCDYVNADYKKNLFRAIYSNDKIKILKNREEISREARFMMRGREYIFPYLFS